MDVSRAARVIQRLMLGPGGPDSRSAWWGQNTNLRISGGGAALHRSTANGIGRVQPRKQGFGGFDFSLLWVPCAQPLQDKPKLGGAPT